MEPEVEGNGEKEKEEREGEIDESLQGMLDELEEKEVLLQAIKLEEEDIEDLSLKQRLNVRLSTSSAPLLTFIPDEQVNARDGRHFQGSCR